MSEDEDNGLDDIVTEEMLWERIPETTGLERANTYYELSARIYARGQYDEALALELRGLNMMGCMTVQLFSFTAIMVGLCRG